jgi:hypothetical protein
MHGLPLAFAFAPAAFFGLLTAALTTVTFKQSRRPVTQGESWGSGTYSLLLMATLLSWVVFLVFIAVGFLYVEAAHVFDGWAAGRD